MPLYILMKPLRASRQLVLVGITCVAPFAASLTLHLLRPYWMLQYATLFALAAACLILRQDVRGTIQVP